jgi:hypothetical protein
MNARSDNSASGMMKSGAPAATKPAAPWNVAAAGITGIARQLPRASFDATQMSPLKSRPDWPLAGVGGIWVKDEIPALSLNSFKVLGGSSPLQFLRRNRKSATGIDVSELTLREKRRAQLGDPLLRDGQMATTAEAWPGPRWNWASAAWLRARAHSSRASGRSRILAEVKVIPGPTPTLRHHPRTRANGWQSFRTPRGWLRGHPLWVMRAHHPDGGNPEQLAAKHQPAHAGSCRPGGRLAAGLAGYFRNCSASMVRR